MNVRESLLQQMPGISQPQKKFLITLFSTILLVYGKVNFTNLSRYSCLIEKTYRRHFLKSFNLTQFNHYFLEKALNPEHKIIAVINCSLLRKSGTNTDGKAYFYNGVTGNSEQGLEIYVISIVEIETRLCYSLSVQQTPSRPPIKSVKKLPPNPKNCWSKKSRRKKQESQSSTPDITRVDYYVQHLKNTRCSFPTSVRYLVADGYYYRSQFWDAVRDLNLDFIGKLRSDANLRYLYTGEQKKLGTPRKYDGKVDCHDLSRLNFVKDLKPGVSLYTLEVGRCCLNCPICLACIFEVQANGKIKNPLLFSTDIHLPPEQILEYYQTRFQIEFIFRDAKQFTGLSGQARHLPRLDFHFKASLIALNLAKHELSSCHSSAKSFVFSLASYKRLEFNNHLLCTFIDKLDLDPDLILNHPNLPSVLSYGTLAA